MPTQTPWTEADDDRLKAMHAEGRSLHSIAKDMGRGKASIHRHAERLELSWDRTATANATTAVVVDNRARRALITSRLYNQAEEELAGLEAAAEGWRTILKGESGVEHETTLTFAPSRDRRDVADILSRHLTSAAKLEAVDAATNHDLPAVDAWIKAMTSGNAVESQGAAPA